MSEHARCLSTRMGLIAVGHACLGWVRAHPRLPFQPINRYGVGVMRGWVVEEVSESATCTPHTWLPGTVFALGFRVDSLGQSMGLGLGL